MGKLFGTDGIRGKAGEYPMNAKIAERTGRAVARFFSKTDGPSKIFIGRDTRESGPMLESALVEGIGAVGANAALAGVLPTPGIAYLAATLKAAAGIVISASHNPYYDNGIKIFNGDGYKLSDEVETAIENMILEGGSKGDVGSVAKKGQVTDESGQARNYFTFLANVLSPGISFKELNIILDCANGATHSMAPELFSGFGAGVEALSIEPNGKNINDGCGSEHPGDLIEKVLSTGAGYYPGIKSWPYVPGI
jgi:phosphoglucosamine mutase